MRRNCTNLPGQTGLHEFAKPIYLPLNSWAGCVLTLLRRFRISSPDGCQWRRFTGSVSFRWRKLSVSIEEKVIGIVSDQLDVPKEEISKDSSFVDDLKADSLDIVELVMALEDEFDVKIPDEDYDKIKTVGNAITYIEGKQ
jgi:acyl carrier protein